MGPPWPRLALRSLVRGGPAGLGCGLGWPRQEWPGVAKPLIQLHLVAFRCFLVVYAGTRGGVQEWPTFNSVSFGLIPSHSSRRLGPGFHPHPSLLPSREKGSDRLRGNEGSRWRHRRDRVVGTGTGSGGVPWLRPGSDRVGVGLATLAGTLAACVSGLHTPGGRNRGLAAALESSYSLCGISATVNCRDDAACWGWRSGLGGGASFGSTLGVA